MTDQEKREKDLFPANNYLFLLNSCACGKQTYGAD